MKQRGVKKSPEKSKNVLAQMHKNGQAKIFHRNYKKELKMAI